MAATLTAFRAFGIHSAHGGPAGRWLHRNRTRTGVISAWSAEAEQLFGWSRAEAIGMSSHQTIPARGIEPGTTRRSPAFSRAPDQPIGRQEIPRVHRDGTSFAPSSRSRSKAAVKDFA